MHATTNILQKLIPEVPTGDYYLTNPSSKLEKFVNSPCQNGKKNSKSVTVVINQ